MAAPLHKRPNCGLQISRNHVCAFPLTLHTTTAALASIVDVHTSEITQLFHHEDVMCVSSCNSCDLLDNLCNLQMQRNILLNGSNICCYRSPSMRCFISSSRGPSLGITSSRKHQFCYSHAPKHWICSWRSRGCAHRGPHTLYDHPSS